MSASPIGYFPCGDLRDAWPDAWTLGGLAVTIGAGLFPLRRERHAVGGSDG